MRFISIFLLLLMTPAWAGQDIRVTAQHGVPVTTADIAGTNSVCLEPYKSPHGQLTTFDGINWSAIDVERDSPANCLSTSGLTANTNYDIVVSASGGLPVLAWSPAYANDTTPPARAWQDGMEVLASDHTKLIVGACRINSLIQCEDNHTHRWLSNYYKPEPREMWVQDPALTWNNCTTPQYCNGTAYQQAHGNPANQLEYVAVVPRLVAVNVQVAVIAGSSSGGGFYVGIGLDGSIGDVSNCGREQASIPSALSTVSYQTSACYLGTPGQGRHTVLWLEHIYGTVSVPPTWMGSVPPSQVSVIAGMVMN